MSQSFFESIVHLRRSVRKYDADAEFNHDDVATALELTTLSPIAATCRCGNFIELSRMIKKQG